MTRGQFTPCAVKRKEIARRGEVEFLDLVNRAARSTEPKPIVASARKKIPVPEHHVKQPRALGRIPG